MKYNRRLIVLIPLAIMMSLALALLYSLRTDLKPIVSSVAAAQWQWFQKDKPPLPEVLFMFDMGVADVDGDGRLDIYTSNHNYRQYLWLADGRGGFRDMSTKLGMAQSSDFPGWEQTDQAPPMDKPGLYIFWQKDTLHFRTHNLKALGAVNGTLRLFSPVKVVENEGFHVQVTDLPIKSGEIEQTSTHFSADQDAHLVLYITSKGAPFHFSIDSAFPLDHVFMGSDAVSPRTHDYSLDLRDRHGMAWTDLNGDGRLDVFITRGAIGGTLRNFPDSIRRGVHDELLVSGPEGRYREITAESGIEKKACSGRHVKWVDFDRNGRLALFINCQDRGFVKGSFPKQFYRQDNSGRFTDVATEVGLDLPRYQFIDLAWFDVDNDGDIDLLSNEDTGIYLYRQEQGRFVREEVYRPEFQRADLKGLRNNAYDYWQFDGKLSLADIDGDDDLDVFIASKKGNVLLINEGGKFKPVDPTSRGLPAESVAAAWVDYDNDGRMDLYTVPQGLFHQESNGSFKATGLLTLPENKYQAAIPLWFDKDNDGTLDLLLALEDNASLWRWWEKPFKSKDELHGKDDRFRWRMSSYKNIGAHNHWLQLNLVGSTGNRQAIGARVTLVTPEGRQRQEVGASDGAYLSQGHYRLYFGLGKETKADEIRILWPDGAAQILKDVPADRLMTVRKGP